MKHILLVVAVMVTMLSSLVYITTQTIAPDYGFDLTTNAVLNDVDIVFDDMAVPHIYADSETDAMHALGYVHAMERLWQMDLLRRAGGGELSALLGPDMVENDKYLRTLGMGQAAERTVERIEADTTIAEIKASMQAYLDGINAFIATKELPFEYRLINARPEPFDMHDVYCATGFMSYSFAIHLKTEPILDWMASNLDSALIADVYWNEDGFQRNPLGESARDISGLANRVHNLDALRPVPQWIGSNAWVLSGDRTASGEVLFCNDAHIAYASPSVWYEAHVVAPELEYYGNHIGGLPFPVIGHTRDHAWGITMFVNDDIDLYRETLDGNRYLHGEEWLPLKVRTETIEVAGKAPVTFEVRETHHGPLIEEEVAMWWAFTQYPENRMHEAFYGFSREEGLDRFEANTALIHAPGLNMLYGDKEGNIAWWASAKLPVRPEGVDTKVALDGTDPNLNVTEWHGFDVNPKSVNPASGFVCSANNAPAPNDSIAIPGHYYAGNTRARAIMKALSAPKNDWTLPEAQAIQLDHHSPVYESNARMLAEYAAQAGVDVGVLRGWDGSHLAEEVAPTAYYRWMYRTIQGAMFDEFEAAAGAAQAQEKFEAWHKTIVSENAFPKLLANAESPWWDDVRTDAVETASDIVARAWTVAREDLTRALGDNPEKWQYGRLHTVVHEHAMKDAPLVGDFLSVGPYALPAAKDALNKYEFKLKEEVNFEVFSGPSMRIGIDFTDVAASESILPTGQSGNAFSPFYDNQAALYHAGEFRKQRMDREDIEAHQTAVARLRAKK
ncbi:MAG: penicillin acylase family protein [Bacteroidota bacterium]|nr:penicillin acylase family protein [Bacteroidota bacterium]